MNVRYTDVRVKLVGQDGNAFSILGRVQSAVREARIPQDQIHAFLTEAMASDYDGLLATCMRWASCGTA